MKHIYFNRERACEVNMFDGRDIKFNVNTVEHAEAAVVLK